mmetsp:Transcript_12058/g.14587  ORF Transcript_12058/g.14587 Transcript_12058/m.14587 type:complete len:94 (-) Transcript_12058:28-309(-)
MPNGDLLTQTNQIIEKTDDDDSYQNSLPLSDDTEQQHPVAVEEKVYHEIHHKGMPECSKGLRVKPFSGGGALFYHKHGNGVNDEMSSHGRCPC